MIDKILIALDYGPTAQKIAEIGFSLGEKNKTSITLLHVIADPSYYVSNVYDPVMGFSGYVNMDISSPAIMNDIKNQSFEFLEKTRHHLKDDNIKTIVKEGSIAESILEVAHEIHANTIVMGSHSSRWLENILMGSITEFVLHRTTIPLLIIPTKKH